MLFFFILRCCLFNVYFYYLFVYVCRYEVRVEACTLSGCAARDWSSVQTLESPPAGHPAPLLELHTNPKGIQTVLLLSWSPPAELNEKLLHYELYRKHSLDTESWSVTTLVYRNSSTSCHDDKLLPYTAYKYQVTSVSHFTQMYFTLQISELTVIGAFDLNFSDYYITQSMNRFFMFSQENVTLVCKLVDSWQRVAIHFLYWMVALSII